MQGFAKRTKTPSTSIISRSHNLMRNSFCVVASVGARLPVQSQERWVRAFQSPSLPGQRLRFVLLAHSSSGPSVLCPQGSQSLRPVQTNPGRTGDCRSWLDLEEQFFWRRIDFPANVRERGGVKMIHKFKHIF